MPATSREQQLQTVLQESVDKSELAGAVALVYRKGQTEHVAAGWSDLEARRPMRRDSIFRIASMTKPVTSVAALMLVDEGLLKLDEPIARVAPEFEAMRVLRSPNGPLDDTEPAKRQITFKDLLTHCAGFTYADFHRGPIAQAYRDALGFDIDSHNAPDDWIRSLASLPLVSQPGAVMTYGVATDLLGLLIARIERAPLSAVLKRRIFDPLGMNDTGFIVPPENRNRRACAYGFDENARLTKLLNKDGVFVEERPASMTYESGGAGLWSTVDDYLKFAGIFLGNGEIDGFRLLRPETLARMMANQLTDDQRANSVLLGRKPFAVGKGFGLGVSMILEPNHNDFELRGSAGTVTWPGAFGGWWQADPVQDLIFIFLAHNMVNLPQMAKGIGLGVWSAIERAQQIALA